jgi:hypothetical protein
MYSSAMYVVSSLIYTTHPKNTVATVSEMFAGHLQLVYKDVSTRWKTLPAMERAKRIAVGWYLY